MYDIILNPVMANEVQVERTTNMLLMPTWVILTGT